MASKFEDAGKKYGFMLGILVGLLIWMLPTPESMTIVQHKLLSIFGGAVVLWISIGVSFATSTFLIVTLLYFWIGNLEGKVNASGKLIHQVGFVMTGFASSALWLLVTGFVISIAMTQTGVARRVALKMMRLFGRTPMGATFAPMVANLIVAPLTPSNTARTAAMLPIIEGVAQAYKVEKGTSNFGRGLYLANTFASNITASAFLTGTIPNPIAIGMIVAVTGATAFTTWGFWALAALPTNILVLIAAMWIPLKLYPPEMKAIPGGLEYIDDELKHMGPMSANEKKAIVFFLLALGLWASDMWHGFNSAMVAFLVSTLILLPRIGVLTWQDAQKGIPWELFVYFGGVITLSDALMKTRAFEWVIKGIIGSMGLTDVSMMPLLIILMGFTIFSHAIWSTTTAMAGVMIPIYIGLAQTFNFPVAGFVLPLAILMGYALFLPFNTMGNIIMFGAGYYTVSEQIKSSCILGLVAWGLWAVTALVWFPLINLY